MSLPKTLGAALTVLLVAAAGLWTLRRASQGEAAEPGYPVVQVERRDIEVVAEAAGLVEPVRVVEVKSNASGEVLTVTAETGDRVERGALLAEIDPRDVQSALDQAEADLESARVRLRTAEAEKRRAERLHRDGVLSEQEVEAAVEAEASARAALVRAETSVRLAREKRNDVTIRAPVAGTVLERGAEPGQIIASATANVSGGTTLFRMADLSEIQVRTKVDEVDIGRIRQGQEAQVTVEAYPGRTFVGAVARIEPQAVVEQNVTLFPVLVRLDNSEGLLRPGMNAEVTLEVASRPDAVAVPNAAVVTPRDAPALSRFLGAEGPGEAASRGAGGRRGRPEGAPAAPGAGRPGVVFVHGPAGVEARTVTLGLSDWEYTEVVEGVEPGEAVVVASVALMQQRQQDLSDRMRQRFGGPLGSGSNRSGGGGGGGTSRGGGRSN
ncbi:MAG TPA: efflux RND transporter periplasmic adaptor subunit [Thermoanaerobaculia bacterium]|nr:efflux RND transporter periplasmic adaptor subunit [Thermoanaerobaculia bacterium]